MYGVHRVGVTIGLSLALSAMALISTTWGQRPGSGSAPAASGRSDGLASLMRSMGTGPQTPITVLMAPAVQKELKLTEAQKTKVYKLSVSATEKQREHFQTMLLGGGGNPQAMLAARNAMRRENEQAITQILEGKQQERFDQIVLRAEGPLAIARPEVASKLNLNRDQRDYVDGIVSQLQRNQFMMYMRLRQGAATGQVGPGQLAQVRGMMGNLRDEAVQELGKVIDRKQKNAFNKMLGEPFDLAKLDEEASDTPPSTSTSTSTSADEAARPEASPAGGKEAATEADAPAAKTATSASSKKTAKGAGSARRKGRSRATPASSKNSDGPGQ